MFNPPQQIDETDIPSDANEIRLFCTIRNEITRLPYLFEYYRRLGIDRFFFIDNGSDDGTRDFLLSQKDTHVFDGQGPFREYRVPWENNLRDRYGTGHWSVSVDADELLTFPHDDKINLKQFCDYLDQEGSEAISTFLLDMYSDQDIEKAVCEPEKAFTEICSYFDTDYIFKKRLSMRGKTQFPPIEPIGGPRLRNFYPEQRNGNEALRWIIHLMRFGIFVLDKFNLPMPKVSIKAPDLYKVSLVKWKKGNAYISATHEMNAVPLSPVSGALMHFKFFADFHDKATKAIQSKQYAGGSVEYKRYLKKFENMKNKNFTYEGSAQYQSSNDFLKHKLIQSTPEFDAYVASFQPSKVA